MSKSPLLLLEKSVSGHAAFEQALKEMANLRIVMPVTPHYLYRDNMQACNQASLSKSPQSLEITSRRSGTHNLAEHQLVFRNGT